MYNDLTYKGYRGTVEFDADQNVFYGKVLAINDLVSFEGKSMQQLKNAFEQAVDDYLVTCKQLNK